MSSSESESNKLDLAEAMVAPPEGAELLATISGLEELFPVPVFIIVVVLAVNKSSSSLLERPPNNASTLVTDLFDLIVSSIGDWELKRSLLSNKLDLAEAEVVELWAIFGLEELFPGFCIEGEGPKRSLSESESSTSKSVVVVLALLVTFLASSLELEPFTLLRSKRIKILIYKYYLVKYISWQ